MISYLGLSMPLYLLWNLVSSFAKWVELNIFKGPSFPYIPWLQGRESKGEEDIKEIQRWVGLHWRTKGLLHCHFSSSKESVWLLTFWKSVWNYLVKLEIHTFWNPAIPLQVNEKSFTCTPGDVSKNVHSTETGGKTWEPLKCPSKGE